MKGAKGPSGVDRKTMGFWRAAGLALVYAASSLPSVALLYLFSLLVVIKVKLGFWPYSPFGDSEGWLPNDFAQLNMAVLLVIVVAIPFAMGMPLLVGLQWLLRRRWTYLAPLACLSSAGLLLYLMFADPGGWTDYLFD